ncbi:Gfo/Idh/MocA family protein [Aestuariivirga sp.]|uniref:Gfo/Idh/MocA family protein n=1 Tax=Aestuariivirga sp. TaxID=2650926 RepID=UPI003592EF03
MARTLGVGIIGCGNISTTYLKLGPLFKGFEIRVVADLNMAAALSRAAQFGVEARTVTDLLASSDIDIVVNLTVPAAHFDVSKQILEAGKHVYSEKPLTLTLAQGKALLKLATARKLHVAAAPDTFLGGSHQQARAAVDDGAIGRIAGGTAHILGPGMEHWHPNPDFFFKPGGGPILDMGPYYIMALINLIGPVKRVAALTGMARKQRVIANGPRMGEKITVKTPTTIHALLEFATGAAVTLTASWDVFAHRHPNLEVYGSDGAMFLPDPNFFGGTVMAAGTDGTPKPLDTWEHPFGKPNEKHPDGMQANYRGAGLADMAQAIAAKRDIRCGIPRMLHVVEIMTAILKSGETGKFETLKTTCTRPRPLGVAEARALLK